MSIAKYGVQTAHSRLDKGKKFRILYSPCIYKFVFYQFFLDFFTKYKKETHQINIILQMIRQLSAISKSKGPSTPLGKVSHRRPNFYIVLKDMEF